MPKTDYVRKMLLTLKEPYKSQALKLYNRYYHKFRNCVCSKSHHLNYPGGLYMHTFHVMITIKEYYLTARRISDMLMVQCPVTYDECIFVAFIHDLGKIYQYSRKPYRHHSAWVFDILNENDIKVNDKIAGALIHHHGGWGPPGELNPLAVILHQADLYASQVLEK